MFYICFHSHCQDMYGKMDQSSSSSSGFIVLDSICDFNEMFIIPLEIKTNGSSKFDLLYSSHPFY